ncbi:MAG: HAD family hydrolase [Candidatus Nanopelagicales bacterium]
MSWLHEVDAVVFDLDDTLLDHTGAAREGLQAWLPTIGLPSGPATIALWQELEAKYWAQLRAGRQTFASQRRARMADFLSAHQQPGPRATAELDALFCGYLTHYETAWRPFPDVAATVAGLTLLGLPVAVLSNGQHEQQQSKLRTIGLGQLTPRLLTAESVGVPKPDQRIYRAAAAALGLPPERVLHVGDCPDLDLTGARHAGLAAVLIDRGGRFSQVSERIAALTELLTGSRRGIYE